LSKYSRKLLYSAGVLAPIWLVLGVAVAGRLYPGYSHFDQAMSELGAIGSPVHTLSPIINNYPLGVLFGLFGYAIIKTFHHSQSAFLSGLLVIVHGSGSIAAGYFPCDVGCKLDSPLPSQSIHNLSGLIMFFSLLFATVLWIFVSRRLLGSKWFGWFCLACSLAPIALLPLMAGAIATGVAFGFYQRIIYGIQVLWIVVFALLLLFSDGANLSASPMGKYRR
jgi:hypothetical membrane protein